jgi:hypothetical protein
MSTLAPSPQLEVFRLWLQLLSNLDASVATITAGGFAASQEAADTALANLGFYDE